MLKIIPVQEKKEQEEFCNKVIVEYDPDEMCYAAFDDDVFVGISLFRIIDKKCIIYNISLLPDKDDYLATYLLAKAPMNFAELCGIKTAVFKDKNIELAKKLEFKDNNGNGVFEVSLEGYFTTPCQRHDCK